MAGELDDIRDVLGFFMGIEQKKEAVTQRPVRPPVIPAKIETKEEIVARGEQITPVTIKAARGRQAGRRVAAEEKKIRAAEEKEEKANLKAVRVKGNQEFKDITKGFAKMSGEEQAQDLINRGYKGAVIREYPTYKSKWRRMGKTPKEAAERGDVVFKVHRPILRKLIKAKYEAEQDIELKQRPAPGQTKYQQRKAEEAQTTVDPLRQQAIQKLQTAGYPVSEENINLAIKQLGG